MKKTSDQTQEQWKWEVIQHKCAAENTRECCCYCWERDIKSSWAEFVFSHLTYSVLSDSSVFAVLFNMCFVEFMQTCLDSKFVAVWVDELGGSEVQLQYEEEELRFKMLIVAPWSLASSYQQGANAVQKTRGYLIFSIIRPYVGNSQWIS